MSWLDWAGGIAACTGEAWSPGIGDPTLTGWLTVAIYLFATLLAARVAKKAPFPYVSIGRERFFWILIAIAMLALAINKQADLQSLLTAVGRCMAQADGWYEDRRRIQIIFILTLGIWSGIFGIFLLWLLWGTLQRTWLPLMGAVFVMSFVLIRAVGFHGVDRLIGMSVPGVDGLSLNFLLEAPGPLLIIFSALLLARAPRLPRDPL